MGTSVAVVASELDIAHTVIVTKPLAQKMNRKTQNRTSDRVSSPGKVVRQSLSSAVWFLMLSNLSRGTSGAVTCEPWRGRGPTELWRTGHP